MKKIPVKIQALSYSQSQVGSYVVVLSEIKGKKKIPVIVKPNDAQYIAIKLESFDTSGTSIHDLIKSMTDIFSARVTEVIIDNFLEGLFYSRVTLIDINGEKHNLKCGVGDAITLSLTYDCPLYVLKNVIDSVGIELGSDGNPVEEDAQTNPKEETISLSSLEKMLQNALENEEYEIASQLRDKINSLKSEKNN